MVRIYYHIYAIDGVEPIIDEQISLIEKNFNFPYILNVGISIANKNESTYSIIEKFSKTNYHIRDVRTNGNEFTTLDLIEIDKDKFGDSDYILYIHTKGASRFHETGNYFNNTGNYDRVKTWRQMMNYFCIEKFDFAFEIFKNTAYNTYGVLLNNRIFYSGNFWWAKANYIKTLTPLENINNPDEGFLKRCRAENWICSGYPNAKLGILFNDYTNTHPYHRYVFNNYKSITFCPKPI